MPWMLSPSTEIDNSTATAEEAQVIGMNDASENGFSNLSMNHDCSTPMAGAIYLHLAPLTEYLSPLSHGFLTPEHLNIDCNTRTAANVPIPCPDHTIQNNPIIYSAYPQLHIGGQVVI